MGSQVHFRTSLELMVKTEHLGPNEDLVIEGDVAIGLWHTLWESVKEIELIVRHNEDQ